MFNFPVRIVTLLLVAGLVLEPAWATSLQTPLRQSVPLITCGSLFLHEAIPAESLEAVAPISTPPEFLQRSRETREVRGLSYEISPESALHRAESAPWSLQAVGFLLPFAWPPTSPWLAILATLVLVRSVWKIGQTLGELKNRDQKILDAKQQLEQALRETDDIYKEMRKALVESSNRMPSSGAYEKMIAGLDDQFADSQKQLKTVSSMLDKDQLSPHEVKREARKARSDWHFIVGNDAMLPWNDWFILEFYAAREVFHNFVRTVLGHSLSTHPHQAFVAA